MIRTLSNSIAAIIVCIGMFAAAPASAQPSLGPVELDVVNQHHQMMYQMMSDMTAQMGKMTEQMSRGELTPEQRKQMADRMELMATIMRRLSSLEARPWIKHADFQKRIDDMRKKMDEMMRDSKTTPDTK